MDSAHMEGWIRGCGFTAYGVGNHYDPQVSRIQSVNGGGCVKDDGSRSLETLSLANYGNVPQQKSARVAGILGHQVYARG